MSNNLERKMIGSVSALFLGMFVLANPMDVKAAASLGSTQVGISADLEQISDASALESAVNKMVLEQFKLSDYSQLGIITVSEGKVNIRNEASLDGKIVGKIGRDAGCDVLEDCGEWLKIKSGKVEGYISSDYVLTGSEALSKAATLLKKVAHVTTNGLKVRTQPNTECEVLDMVGSGQTFDVLEELDEWVKIDLDGEEGYLFKEYVEVGSQLDEALTITEVRYGAGVSDVRISLCEFAKQFVGNRYVWGGTSLTKGADCSGFVLSVFRNYGMSLPRTSREQAKAGSAVSTSEVKPGDLIFYGNRSGINHVAIYIGGGKVVHASNSRVGIIISNMNYRTPVKARRIIHD